MKQTEIEQAAKEYAYTGTWSIKFIDTNYEINGRYSHFIAGADFMRSALEKRFEGLREEFFEECTDLIPNTAQLPKVNMTPHNVFNWFKEKILK